MQGLHKDIYEHQNRIKENDKKIYQKFLELGMLIIKIDPGKITNTVLNETFNEIQKLLKVEPQKRNDIQSIHDIEGNVENIRNTIKEKKKQIIEQEKTTREHYQNIGEAAYNVYKENKDVNEPFKNIFFDLITIDEKLFKNNQNRKDLKEINQADRKDNIIKQFFNISKSLIYEKKQDFLSSRQHSLFIQIGRKVMESEFIKVNEDSVLSEITIPLNAILARIEQIKSELSNLEEDEKKILQRLLELGARGSSTKRIKEIENEIEETLKTIEVKYQELGRQYFFNIKEIKIQLEGVNEITDIIKILVSENDSYRAKIKKLNARIEIERIKEKIIKNNKAMENLKIKIEKEQDDIAALTKTNSDYENEIIRIIKENKLDNI